MYQLWFKSCIQNFLWLYWHKNQVKWCIFHGCFHWGEDWTSFNPSLCSDCVSFLLTSWNFSFDWFEFFAPQRAIYTSPLRMKDDPLKILKHTQDLKPNQSSVSSIVSDLAKCFHLIWVNDVWYQCFHWFKAMLAPEINSMHCYECILSSLFWNPLKQEVNKNESEYIEQVKFAQ